MQVQPYLFFDGRCEEAVEFYRRALGAEVTMLMRFKDSPDPGEHSMVPPGAGDKVMHTSFRIGDTTVLATDGRCLGQPSFQVRRRLEGRFSVSISRCLVRRRVEPGSSRSNPPGSPVINAKPRGEMAMINPKVKRIPDGMHTVTPHLICAGAADAIEFYKKAFNAVEVGRAPGPAGKLMHACIRIGDSAIMLVDEFPDWGKFGPKSLKGSPVTIHLYVEDADGMFERAVGAGAKTKMPLEDTFWGDRYGVLEDPFGHHWSVATHIRDVSPEEIQQAAQKACG